MKKYIVNYTNRHGKNGRVGVEAETPEQAILEVLLYYPEKYGIQFNGIRVESVDEWKNGRVRVWNRKEN